MGRALGTHQDMQGEACVQVLPLAWTPGYSTFAIKFPVLWRLRWFRMPTWRESRWHRNAALLPRGCRGAHASVPCGQHVGDTAVKVEMPVFLTRLAPAPGDLV